MNNPLNVEYQPYHHSGDLLNEQLVSANKHQIPQSVPRVSPAVESVQVSPDAQRLSSSGSISSQFKQSSSASIDIITQDGDQVSISYSALIQHVSNESFSSNEQQSSYAYSSRASADISFEFKVKGELDSGEQQAIDALLNDIGGIAAEFFDGDVQAAFNSALELGFDGSELKSLAANFQQNTQAQLVETYQRTERLVNPVSDRIENTSRGPGAAVDVLSQLEQLLNQVKENDLLNSSEDMVKNLLDDMFEMLSEEFEFPIESYLKDVVELL